METQLLRDEKIPPSDHVLEVALGSAYPAFREFIHALGPAALGLTHEWKYYRDGRAWLCKATHRKKTVVWISVWNGFFRLGFYFTASTGRGITDLAINAELKHQYEKGLPIGRLRPLVFDVRGKDQLDDTYTLIRHKMAAG